MSKPDVLPVTKPEPTVELPPARRDGGGMFHPYTFAGKELSLFTYKGFYCDGVGSAFANICGTLAGFNFHYSMFNAAILAYKAMFTGRNTSDAHVVKGEILTTALSHWLALDFVGFPMFRRDEKGGLHLLHGPSTDLPYLAIPNRAALGFQKYGSAALKVGGD